VKPFELFGFQHITALFLVALLSGLAFHLGRSRYSDTVNLLGGCVLALYAAGLWSFKLKDGMDWGYDLPLALCDITFLLCLYCFIKPVPIFLTFITYWGLGGTLQALVTPDVTQAFPSLEFCIFFVGHSVIVFAVFFLLGRCPHPHLSGWPGLRDSFLGLLGYTLVAGLVDLVFGLNYGYLREKPLGASILDHFGDWPLYIFGALGLAFVIFFVLSLLLKFLPPMEGAASQVELS
jgi:hypothetical integral membrane protein (TIGR02206 family)